jgi:hypothetical protein
MFGTIRKHQQWLWILIITVIIVTFVFFFSPEGVQLGGRPKDPIFGSIGGRPISQEEYLQGFNEARLSHFMRSGGREWPDNDENSQRTLERDAVFRVFINQKLKEMGISAGDEALGRLVRERLGNFPPAEFERQHLLPQRLTLLDFERFMRQEAALQQLVNTAGLSAKLLNPKEAEILFRKENEQAITEVALFSASNQIAQVTVNPAELGKFYTNRMPVYRIPERIRVAYVEFPATNFFADADKQIAGLTNFEAQVEEFYYQRGTNNFKGTNDTILSAAEAKEKIKADTRKEFALVEARRKANQFGTALMEQPQADTLASFEKFAAAQGYTVKLTEPFDRSTGLDTNLPPEFRQKAFTLNTNAAVAFNPILGSDAVYVIALHSRIPSEMPPFEKVQDKVATDFKQQQALELARKTATNFYAVVTNAVLQKKAFADVAKQQNVTLITPPPFSPSTTTLTNLDPRINLRALQQFAFDMKPGDLTGIVPIADGAIIMHLAGRKPVDDAKLKAELPEFLNRIRLYRHNEAFNAWFRKQVEQARVVPPQRDLTPTPPAGQGGPPPSPQSPPGPGRS